MKFFPITTYFVLLFFTSILVLVSEAHYWRCDYTYVQSANGYFKFHNIPVTWRDARLRCQDEGAVLASPYPQEISDALIILMRDGNMSRPVFTGIHAIFAKGDFYTVDGIPISKIPIRWMIDEPDNYKNEEDCLVFTPDGFAADKNCNNTYSYFCYKQKKEDDNILHGSCGSTDPAYEYSDVTHSCYKLHTVPRQWSRAHMACSSEGGHLAVINSEMEAQVIRELWAKFPANKFTGNFDKGGGFIGIHNQIEYFDWKTIHGETLAEAGYARFAAVFPKKNYDCGCADRACAIFDCSCNDFKPFICEKKPNSLICLHDEEY